jgi:hypothetical protein
MGGSVAESGSNAGSDFVVGRYADAGGFIDAPLSINRATGAVTLQGAANGNISINVATGGIIIYGYQNYTASNYYAHFASTAIGGPFSVTNGGYAIVSGNRMLAIEFDATSDERLKKNIEDLPLDYAWRFVQTARPVFHEWIDERNSGRRVGFIAQEVAKAGFVEMLSLAPNDDLKETTDVDGFVSPKGGQFALAYDKVVPILTATIADLKRQLDAAMTRIEALEARP